MPGAGLALELKDQGLVRFAPCGEFLPQPLLSLAFETRPLVLLVDFLLTCGDRTEVGEDAWNQGFHGAGAVVVPALAVDAVGVVMSRAFQAQATGPEFLVVLFEPQVRVLLLLGERGGGRRQFAQVEGFLDQEFDALTVDARGRRSADRCSVWVRADGRSSGAGRGAPVRVEGSAASSVRPPLAAACRQTAGRG